MFDRCLYFNSNHLSRVVGKIWKDAFAEVGLAPSHAYLLRLLLKHPGLVQKEIGEKLHLEKSTITRFVDKMVEEGYLQRKTPHSGNLKEQQIYPTKKAKKISNRLEEIGDLLYLRMQSVIKNNLLGELVGNIKQTANSL